MPPEMINIALTIPLRDLIAAQAEAEGTTQDRMADTLLVRQLDQAEDAQTRGKALVARSLTHPRLAERGDRATLNIARATNDRAVARAKAVTQETGLRVTKTRLIHALLWHVCAPMPARRGRPPLSLPPPPPQRPTVTIQLSVSMSAQIGVAALQHSMTREALAAMLLDQSLAALTERPALARDLAAEPREPMSNGAATIQVPRQHDDAIQELADRHFAGVKAQALQALLVYGLEHLEPPAPSDGDMPDRPVYIDGALYTRVARLALAQRAAQGRTVSIRALVEDAVRKDVERAEARMGIAPDPSTATNRTS